VVGGNVLEIVMGMEGARVTHYEPTALAPCHRSVHGCGLEMFHKFG